MEHELPQKGATLSRLDPVTKWQPQLRSVTTRLYEFFDQTTLADTLSGQQADVRCQMRMLTSCASSASLGSVLFKRRATKEGR